MDLTLLPLSLSCSVLIATYRRSSICARTACQIAPLKGCLEVLIVDQTPADEIEESFFDALRQFPHVRYFQMSPPSAVRARNVGIQRARGDIVLIVDDDVEPSSHLVEAHLAAYTDSTVGGVAGYILNPGEQHQQKAHPLARDPGAGWWYTHFNHGERMEVRHARGCNMSFRRELLLRMGGYDTFFCTPFREDSDLGFRLKAYGFRLIFEPNAKLRHLEARSGGTRPQLEKKGLCAREWEIYRRLFRHTRDETYFLFKHFRGIPLWQYVFRAYVTSAGLSRWPWRLVAKHAICLAATFQAWWHRESALSSYFRDENVREIDLAVPRSAVRQRRVP